MDDSGKVSKIRRHNVRGKSPVNNENNDAAGRRRRRQHSKKLVRSWSRRASREFIRRRSSLAESLPDTPQGWAVIVSILSSALLGYEVNVQKALTCPPSVYGQFEQGLTQRRAIEDIHERLTATTESILSRSIKPSLFVGTNGIVASLLAYTLPHSASSAGFTKFREIVPMTQYGGQVGLEWELPSTTPKEAALRGPLDLHVVLILHGINNHAKFGYIQGLSRACAKRGWAAIGMNYRACGGVEMTTPRIYTAGYTGDIRCVVQTVGARLARNRRLFLIGNSLGANMVTKYLGEEGLSETTPSFVAGGVSLGNPLLIDSRTLRLPWTTFIGKGVQKTLLENWRTLRQHNSPYFQQRVHAAMKTITMGQFESEFSHIHLRNNPYAPFETKVGYPGGIEEYNHDVSSYRYVGHIAVPFLVMTSQDDFLIKHVCDEKLGYCLSNPNVLVVRTKCGGHLGWQETPPDTGSMFGFGTSWADTATTDFISAILDGKPESSASLKQAHNESVARIKTRATEEASSLKARL